MANVLGKTILTGLLLLTLGGCASGPVAPRTTVIDPPPPYDPTLSRAMNIVIAGGLVSRPGGPILNDVPAVPLDAGRGGRSGTRTATDLGYAAVNVLNPPPGVRWQAAGAMSALSLLIPPDVVPGQADDILLWIPTSVGASSAEAVAKAGAILRRAYLDTIGRGYKATATHDGRLWLEGPDCPPQTCRFHVGAGHPASLPLPVVKAPAFLRQYDTVYGKIGGGFQAGTGSALKFNQVRLDNPSLAEITAFSQALPDWAFIYLAPKSGRNSVPLVLNQGEQEWFVTPAGTAE